MLCARPSPPQLGEIWSGPKAADTEYARVKAMLTSLNLPVSEPAAWQPRRRLAANFRFMGYAPPWPVVVWDWV